MTEAADPRLPLKRKRVVYKRDYARQIDEVNKSSKMAVTLDSVEQLDAVRVSMLKTKSDLDEMYLEFLGTIDEEDEDDVRLQEELLKERDNFLLNLDCAIGLCVAFRKKFEGASRRDSLNASVTSAATWETNTNTIARLPPITVPTFDGDLRKFLDFKALFENLVHQDETITPVRKMHYLKESLVEEAARTLANISVSNEGYKEAWSRVIAKYDNKRIIMHTHFNDLFSAERIRNESQLRVLLDQMDGALHGLRACGELTDRWSSILAYMLYTRLDNRTKCDFDNTVTNNAAYYDFKIIWRFCETRANNIEARKIEETTLNSKSTANSSDAKRSFVLSKIICVVCQEPHLLIDCAGFMTKTPAERLKTIQTNKLCVNCFSRTHLGPVCPSHKTCKICLQRHHYLLHLGEVTPNTTNTNATHTVCRNRNEQDGARAALPATGSRSTSVIVLPSAKVWFSCGNAAGEARILLDNCSQPTLVSDTFVRRFKLKTFRNNASKPIRGVGFQSVGTARSCRLTLVSRVNSFRIEIEADVIAANAIPYSLHSMTWEAQAHAEARSYALADTAFYARQPTIDKVDLILGAQYVERCLINETENIGDMVLRSTQFGWTLNGGFSGIEEYSNISLTCCLTTSAIESQILEFLDAKKPKSKQISEQVAAFCEEHFESTTTRDDSGRFVVRLPFVADPQLLGDNKNRAVAILQHSQGRAQNEVRKNYIAFMEEYAKLKHMSCVAQPKSSYFIPHHAVLKPDSTTTSTRVVFNASAPSSTGFSLNDLLAVGPQLQPELFDALVRFRAYTIAVSADIAKMYRCILVHPDDRRFQQILWRATPTEAIKTYELNTVTYGTAPASFLAVRCLYALADELQEKQPTVVEAIRNHFYMDDLLIGGASIEEVEALQKAIHQKLREAGLQLRKYQSNSVTIMQRIPRELWLRNEETEEDENAHQTSILGVGWNLQTDRIGVRVEVSNLTESLSLTKRQMLAEIAKVFDPLGLIAPVTIRAKILIKAAWNEKINWDDQISDGLAAKVREYLAEIVELSQFSIGRTYSDVVTQKMELVGFCSASNEAYSAVVYARSPSTPKSNTVRLICAKTRIAPTKPTPIERLELQSAVLLSELALRISKILKVGTERVTLCCESQHTLTWIANPRGNWTTYVHNRVEKIHATLPIRHWRFISDEVNPAKLATLGVSSRQLLRDEEWIDGPQMLRTNAGIGAVPTSTTEMEIGPNITPAVMSTAMENGHNRSLVDRCNSYTRLIAVIGRLISFARRWKISRSSQVTYDLNKYNIKSRARIAVILLFQEQYFKPEIEALQKKLPVPTQSKLRTLDPFLDDDGVVRVRGRLDNSTWSFSKRCPIIVPKGCNFLTLYIRYVHNTFCHATKSFVVAFILAEFWVCGGLRSKVKAVINSCVTCARYRAETYSQIMGQLPRDRVVPSRPFSNVGLDFFGPFNARCVGHRSVKFNKIYACVFVCMCTRAVHIEITSNLSSTHFLMSFHRFVARRGLPLTMYSDCGTNFVGANNYINLAADEIQQDPATHPVHWIFNPPRAPHRGGIWESAVKSAKAHACRVVGNRAMDFEEYVTLFTRIESILNSRPICYRNVAELGETVLTPSHFLIGSLPYVIPEPEESRLPLWKRYELLRGLIQSFWRCWRSDYLNMLQRKEKWNQSSPDVKVGQIVLLKNEAPPCSWPMAVIEEVFPGPDSFVRTVHIRVPGGAILRRDIRSLVKLPIEPLDDDPLKGGHVATSVPSG